MTFWGCSNVFFGYLTMILLGISYNVNDDTFGNNIR